MNVTMIYPKTGLDKIGVSVGLPLPFLQIGAVLKDKHKCVLIDQRISKDWAQQIGSCADETNIWLISAMTGEQLKWALKAAEVINLNSDAPIVWGGVHPSLLPKETLDNKYVDFVVIGDGEEAITSLLKCCEEDIPEKEMFETDFVDVNDLPAPDYSLIKDMKPYFLNLYNSPKTLSLSTDRGCPHRCTYCYNSAFHKRKVRLMRPEILIERIKELVAFGAESIDMVGDNFFVDVERVKTLCELLDKENLKINFNSNCRADYIDRFDIEFLKLIRAHGFKEIFIGVESGSQKILDYIKKDLTVEQVLSCNKKLKEADITPIYSFMCGFPTETHEDVFKTLDLMLQLSEENPKASITSLKIYTPFPGTELYDICVKEGMKVPATLEEWSKFDYNTVHYKKDGLLLKLSYITYFLDGHSMLNFTKNDLLKKCIVLYGKLVRWRIKNKIFMFMPEWRVIKMVQKL